MIASRLLLSLTLKLFFVNSFNPSKIDFCKLKCPPFNETSSGCWCIPSKNREYIIEDIQNFRQLILDVHNELRNKIARGDEKELGYPTAANMAVLNYDLELEHVARCYLMYNFTKGHDKCRMTTSCTTWSAGQNLFGIAERNTSLNIIKMGINTWYNELIVPPTKEERLQLISKCNSKRHTDRFTQMVWAKTVKIGCARAWIPYNPSVEYRFALACNYAGTREACAGNFPNRQVYVAGSPCSQCGDRKCNKDIPGGKYEALCGESIAAQADPPADIRKRYKKSGKKEVQLSFPHRNVEIKKGIDPKEFYDLETEIGRGKFGTVYKCREKNTGLTLAAKFIAVPKKEDRRNVEREVDIMKTLQHPRLIQLYDAFENGKVMCVILEYIEGGELFERVIDDDFVLTEKSCTVFMRQICEGIDFIHKQRIVHLDMKPENILCLTRTGNRIKIIDFGLARRFDPDKKLQVLFGTPEFVAPEVVNFDQIGFGTDMWSVGVICYVLLSGLSPFMGHTDVETMANVTIAKYDFDDEAFNEISDTAKDFIGKLLIKDITQRMSAEECLNHDWLKRKQMPISSSMDMTKDNLRQFVERWNEHPNSPYVFELSSHIISPPSWGMRHLSDSQHSLVGMSPSPCGSLASSPGSDNAFAAFDSTGDDLLLPSLDHLRRASDSTCILKGPDVTERINLAEEIRKLSDKLFQLSNMTTSVTNNQFDEFSLPTIVTSKTNKEQNYSAGEKVSENASFCQEQTNSDVPWRRTKYKLSYASRDVPLLGKKKFNDEQFNNVTSYNSTVTYSSSTNNEDSSPDGTKDLLLRLLEQWDGPHGPSRLNNRHGSVSTEWSEFDTLGQRSISTLNSFFQSRATNKINSFHSQQ